MREKVSRRSRDGIETAHEGPSNRRRRGGGRPRAPRSPPGGDRARGADARRTASSDDDGAIPAPEPAPSSRSSGGGRGSGGRSPLPRERARQASLAAPRRRPIRRALRNSHVPSAAAAPPRRAPARRRRFDGSPPRRNRHGRARPRGACLTGAPMGRRARRRGPPLRRRAGTALERGRRLVGARASSSRRGGRSRKVGPRGVSFRHCDLAGQRPRRPQRSLSGASGFASAVT